MAAKKEFPEEGELVLCTVEQILKTSVFVKLDGYDKVGIVTTAEISPGRIRNIRDFVVLNKKIVCKVLRVDVERGHIDLSLRRVSLKERKDLLEEYSKEKSAVSILSKILGENLNELSEKIKSEYKSLYIFLQSSRENPDLLKKFGIKEDDAKKIFDAISEKIKIKKIEAKAKIEINGIKDIDIIKEALKIDNPKVKVSYISAPFYLISIEGKDYKDVNHSMSQVLSEIKSRVKKAGGEVEESETAEMS